MRNITLILFLLFAPMALHSQSIDNNVIVSSGGSLEDNGYILSWSIGEPIVETLVSANNMITQGFHQAFPLGLSVSAVNELPGSVIAVSVYPNPTVDVIFIYTL
jgi:hypothetical protein